MRRDRLGSFAQQVGRGPRLPSEAHPWWWHPSRVGVPEAPARYLRVLDRIDPDLRATVNNYTGEICVWAPKPTLQTKWCWGWQLLFKVHPSVAPDLVGAHLFEVSARKWGGAKAYFDAIEREMDRERAAQERRSQADAVDQAMEVFDHSQIRVSMHGPSSGSKFSTYHT